MKIENGKIAEPVIGRVTTLPITDSQTGAVIFEGSTYDVWKIIEINGKPAYVTTTIYACRAVSVEPLIIVQEIVAEYQPY